MNIDEIEIERERGRERERKKKREREKGLISYGKYSLCIVLREKERVYFILFHNFKARAKHKYIETLWASIKNRLR